VLPPDLAAELARDYEADAGRAVVELVADYLHDARSREVRPPLPPRMADLDALFDEPPPADGHPLAEVLARVRRDVVPNAAWLHDPTHMGHQLSPPLGAPIWIDALSSAFNPSLAVAELSGAATALERRVTRWLADLAGLPEDAGGTLAMGATEATFTALLAARAAALPDAWQHGVGGEAGVVLCSEHAHYSVARAVAALGLGADRCLRVPADARFRLDPEALAERLDGCRDAGRTVVAVVANAGSTAVGAFDDLAAIGAICDERGIWLHVDGAHGASALLSERHRSRMAGSERATTIAWDPHKMMLLPLATGVLLARDKALLDRAFQQSAPYLFHGRDALPVDQGVRSFQTSRRGDALRLWFAWQRYGTRGFAALYDHLCSTTHAIWELVCEHPAFEPLHEPECNILCFRPRDADAAVLRPAYNASGHGYITLTTLAGAPALRITVMNPLTTPDDGKAMLDAVAALR
jgi:L-2,4-diaminobutyrate decarboxylase